MNKELNKVLGDPVWDEFDENTQRIRRNLLITAGLGSFVYCVGLQFKGTATIEGIEITGLDTKVVYVTLFLIIFYNLLHFCIVIHNYLLRWRLRLTANPNTDNPTAIFSDAHDYSYDVKQPTLYLWWKQNKKLFSNHQNFERQVESFLSSVQSFDKDAAANLSREMGLLAGHLKNLNEKVKWQRIDESLERFDQKFWRFQKVQKFRWIIIEATFPIALGLAALTGLFTKLYS